MIAAALLPVNFESLRKYCATLPGATRDIKWGADEVYSVGAKMFAAFGIERGRPANVGFKCEPDRFLELTDQNGIIPAPYLARAHWVLVQDAKALSDMAARDLVRASHALIFSKLTKKQQTTISGDGAATGARR